VNELENGWGAVVVSCYCEKLVAEIREQCLNQLRYLGTLVQPIEGIKSDF
jgi:Asp/Glu/hydantoin racemase